ncbi:GNAT family N-acetyltransferase [Paenibacillus macerans]|uniref:GNAT family N-acetyltransferase n=1 Tax=Paenibacillus macerans TaxID=44252 RepID=UPI00203B25E7|nr:GNAT family N-acetyltransferase [Paenibacillus macerans]MCM3700493.1 GNAT family N-acetyltransferase [Paenibacillus macerans]
MSGIRQKLQERFPVLESERLVMRKLELRDADALYDCITAPAVRRHVAIRSDKLQFPERLFRYFEESYRSLRDLHFAVEYKWEGRFIGLCSLQYLRSDGQKARIGYMLSPAYWNRGLATEAAQTVLGFGFDTLGLAKIEARCSRDNPASERVLQKCGMRREAHIPPAAGREGQEESLLLYIGERNWFF